MRNGASAISEQADHYPSGA
eukprot:Gb_23781 [translate_table: standard]